MADKINAGDAVAVVEKGSEIVSKAAKDIKENIQELIELDPSAIFKSAKDQADFLSESVTKIGQRVGGLTDFYKDLRTNMNQVGQMTSAQSTIFSTLATGMLGVRKSFESLGNMEGVNTFTAQLDDMSALIERTTGRKIPASLRAMAESADNVTRLETGFIQLSARTGNLGNVFERAGEQLENFDAIIQNQSSLVANSAKALNVPTTVVQKYYGELLAVPGAMEEMVKSSSSMNGSVNMLTASINFARGAGRSYSEVIDDMKVAYENYNLVGEDALKFTARMSELSNNLQIPLEKVRGALSEVAGEFKYTGNNAEGAAKMFNTYLTALKDVGISGPAALSLVKNMTSSISSLNIAQKALISSQSGGPGGLMGGYQIDKLLRDGKMDEVMAKIQKQMNRQLGKIVTLEEAASSPQAAAQLTKQVTMLQQGPLGSYAKTNEQAYRMLEAMKALQDGKKPVIDLKDEPVQRTMDIGAKLQERSLTVLGTIQKELEAIRMQADQGNNIMVRQAIGVGSSSVQTGGPINPATENANRLRGFIRQGETEATNAAINATSGLTAGGQLKDTRNKDGLTSLNDLTSLFGKLGDVVVSGVKAVGIMTDAPYPQENKDGDRKQTPPPIATYKSSIVPGNVSTPPTKQNNNLTTASRQVVADKAKTNEAVIPPIPEATKLDVNIIVKDDRTIATTTTSSNASALNATMPKSNR